MLTAADLQGLDSGVRLITVFLIFLLVLAATWLVTRWIAGYQKGQMGKGNIEIVETFRLSQTKYIQIVRTGSKYLVLGVCKESITLLTTIEKEELDFSKAEKTTESFQEVFQRVKEWNQKKEK